MDEFSIWYDIVCTCGTHLTGVVSNFNNHGVIVALAAVTLCTTLSLHVRATHRCMHCLYCVMRFIVIHGTCTLPVVVCRCLPDSAVIDPLAGAAKGRVKRSPRKLAGKPEPYIRVIDGEPSCVSEYVSAV